MDLVPYPVTPTLTLTLALSPSHPLLALSPPRAPSPSAGDGRPCARARRPVARQQYLRHRRPCDPGSGIGGAVAGGPPPGRGLRQRDRPAAHRAGHLHAELQLGLHRRRHRRHPSRVVQGVCAMPNIIVLWICPCLVDLSMSVRVSRGVFGSTGSLRDRHRPKPCPAYAYAYAPCDMLHTHTCRGMCPMVVAIHACRKLIVACTPTVCPVLPGFVRACARVCVCCVRACVCVCVCV